MLIVKTDCQLVPPDQLVSQQIGLTLDAGRHLFLWGALDCPIRKKVEGSLSLRRPVRALLPLQHGRQGQLGSQGPNSRGMARTGEHSRKQTGAAV